MKILERIVWPTLLALTLIALGISIKSHNSLQKVFEREQYLYLMSTARMVQSMEANDLEQAIKTGRIRLTTYTRSYVARHDEGALHVSKQEHAKLMKIIQREFPELLAPIDPDTSTTLN